MLAAHLERASYDVVCLQEVQTHGYRRLLVEAAASYRCAAYVPHVHAPRGGLLSLTRPEIVRSEFTLFRARDLHAAPMLMDWLLYKGVLLTEVRCGGQRVVVLNTHLNANYSGDWGRHNRYAQVEQRQLAQLAEIVAAQPRDTIVVAAGDFNIPRASWLYEELLAASGLADPLAGDKRPTYRALPGLPVRYAQAIDFALLRAPELPALSVTSALCFTEPSQSSNGPALFLSDHVGVELRISWEEKG